MLSGSRPRGSSSTPVSGKIGRVSGNTALSRSLMPPPLSLTPRLREHQRGQPPPRAQGQRVGRPHRLEEFDELLAGRLLVPFAVAPEQGQQLLYRRLALAAAEQRGRQFEARLVVVRILLQPPFQATRAG